MDKINGRMNCQESLSDSGESRASQRIHAFIHEQKIHCQYGIAIVTVLSMCFQLQRNYVQSYSDL